jgi:integrase
LRGNITRRGQHSWRLKFDSSERDASGKRNTRYLTIRGSRREAERKLAALLTADAAGSYVEPSQTTVGEFVGGRIAAWEAAGRISARTLQRYQQLLAHQIQPHLGAKLLQKLRPLDIEAWHAALRANGRVRGSGGCAPRTISHAHKLLGAALADAAEYELVHRNVARAKAAPRVSEHAEIVIVRDVPSLVAKLHGWRLGGLAFTALFTGMRLGECLALRWSRVDLDKRKIEVREALEHTKAHGTRLKPPKTPASRRDISMPDVLVGILHEHRKRTLQLRLQLGTGRLPEDALLFADLEGRPLSPNAVSAAWADFARGIGMPEVTFHALRHSHASMLIDQGVDIVTIAKRLGHSKPDVTLRVYAHLFRDSDGKAAAAINAALGA